MLEHPKFKVGPDGTLLLNFGEYGQEVEVAAVAGRGGRVLTVRDVGRAEIWDVGSGDRVGVIRPESPLEGTHGAAPTTREFNVFIEAAALDAEGTLALLGLNDGTAGIFRVADGARIAQLHPPGESPASGFGVIRAVTFTEDYSMALVGFSGRRVGVWSADGQRLIAFLAAPSGARVFGEPFVRDTLVTSVAASGDGSWVFAGCTDGTAAIWELATGRVVFEAVEHAEDTLAVFDDEYGLGWATTAGNVWACTDDGPPRKILATGEQWSEVAFARGALLARCSSGAVTHWTFAGVRSPQFDPQSKVDARWSDRAKSVGFGAEGRWHYPEGGRRLVVQGPGGRAVIERNAQLVSARFAGRHDVVATEGWNDHVELWSTDDGRLLRDFTAPGGVGRFCISPDGRFLAIGEVGHGGGLYPRDVLVFDTDSGRLVHRLQGHRWQIKGLEFSPNGRELASLADEVIVWKLSGLLGPRVSFRTQGDRVYGAIRFLSDGRLVVVSEGSVRIFSGGRLHLSAEVPIGFRSPWCLSHDDRFLSVAINQGISRTELSSGATRRICAPMPRPEGLHDSPSARRAGIRTGAWYWRTERGAFLHQSDGPRGWVERLAVSPAGEVLVPSQDGAALLTMAPEPAFIGTVPFEGKLRASRVLGDRVILVNEKGQVFHSVKPRQQMGSAP